MRLSTQLRKILATTVDAITPYKFERGPELPQKALIVGAPHTSYYDGVLMVVGLWKLGRQFHFFVKDGAMNSPFGPLIRAVGGLSVDRSKQHGLVDRAVSEAAQDDDFLLVITPKGTRSQRDYWKTGFYQIALQANLPIVLGYLTNEPTRRYGWGEVMYLSGNPKEDMDKIRAFYSDKTGVHPEKRSEPRLKIEEVDAGED